MIGGLNIGEITYRAFAPEADDFGEREHHAEPIDVTTSMVPAQLVSWYGDKR